MELQDMLAYSFDGLRRRGLRSWLTIIGIVIGIVAIVLLIALGQGIDYAVRGQLAFFGDDTINIQPGGSSSSGFVASRGGVTEKDLEAAKRVAGVEYISPVIQGSVLGQYKTEQAAIFVMGFATDYEKIYQTTNELEAGRGFHDGERGVVIIGHSIAEDFWGPVKNREKVRVGDRIIIANQSFQVIGILAKSGSGLTAIADIGVYMPYEQARDVLPLFKGNDKVTMISLKVAQGADVNVVQEKITRELDNIHRTRSADERNFRVVTSAQIQQTIGQVTGLLTLFLAGIAAISLLVGSIGVANTMFMSVVERTREIGVLKAIGASDRAIVNIFLIESGMLGAVGGLIGVIIGVVMCALLTFVVGLFGFDLPVSVSPQLALFGLGVAFFVGVVSGFFPARRAAGMNAVDALRYGN